MFGYDFSLVSQEEGFWICDLEKTNDVFRTTQQVSERIQHQILFYVFGSSSECTSVKGAVLFANVQKSFAWRPPKVFHWIQTAIDYPHYLTNVQFVSILRRMNDCCPKRWKLWTDVSYWRQTIHEDLQQLSEETLSPLSIDDTLIRHTCKYFM